MSIAETQIVKKTKQIVQEPKRWKVILINDDVTPVEFVISLLIELFNHTDDQAEEITMQVHTTGSGIAGIYSFEIAETKATEATTLARMSNFPLQIKIEEE